MAITAEIRISWVDRGPPLHLEGWLLANLDRRGWMLFTRGVDTYWVRTELVSSFAEIAAGGSWDDE